MKRGKTLFWTLVVLIVVAVTLTIIFVSLFGKKSTAELSTSVNNYSTTGYLAKDKDTFKTIDEYLAGVDTTDFNEDERNELKNFRNGYSAYTIIAAFFNRQIYFMEYTNTYKDNRKAVEQSLKIAQKAADNLVSLIEQNERITDGSAYWEHRAWTSMKPDMNTLIENSMDAFGVLIKIYKASVPSNLYNNDYSDVIFYGYNDLAAQFKEGHKSVEAIGLRLYNYANIYFTKTAEEQIIKYSYLDNESGSTTRSTILSIVQNGKDSPYYLSFLETMPA